MILTFNDFIKKYNLKNRATSNIKIYEVLKKVGLDSKVSIYLRDGDFSTNYGVVNLHPSRGTHWIFYTNENFHDSYGITPPEKLSKFITKRNGYSSCSEYQIQTDDSFCASYCLYILYLTKVLGISFKSAVLNLYYHRIS